MSKDICPKCGKLVWLTQRYMIADGQASHIVCESHEIEEKKEKVIPKLAKSTK